MSEAPVKVAIIGPKEGGKTKITNIITGHFSDEAVSYDPTVGVRIFSHIHEQDVRGDYRLCNDSPSYMHL